MSRVQETFPTNTIKYPTTRTANSFGSRTFIDFLTISLVLRMSCTMRGSMPFFTCSFTKHTPLGQTLMSFSSSLSNLGEICRFVQPNSKAPSLKQTIIRLIKCSLLHEQHLFHHYYCTVACTAPSQVLPPVKPRQAAADH